MMHTTLPAAGLMLLLAAAAASAFARTPLLPILVAPRAGESTTTRPAATTQPPATRPAADRIRVDEPKHDFGQVWQGDTVSHSFELVNTGEQPLTILNVRTTCGCAKVEEWEKTVAPGASWRVPLKVDTSSQRGKLNKSLIVMTDDPAQPEVRFVATGEIRPRFEFTPSRHINFGAPDRSKSIRRSLTITNRLDKPVFLTRPQIDNESFRAELREVEAGQKYELSVETVPPLREGAVRAKVTIQTGLEEYPEVFLLVYGYAQPRVSLVPQALLVPQPLKDLYRRRLTLRSNDGTPIHVTGTRTSNDRIRTDVEAVSEDQNYSIWVEIDAGTTLSDAGETITVTTDNPDTPTFTATVRPYSFTGRRAIPNPIPHAARQGVSTSQPSASQPSPAAPIAPQPAEHPVTTYPSKAVTADK